MNSAEKLSVAALAGAETAKTAAAAIKFDRNPFRISRSPNAVPFAGDVAADWGANVMVGDSSGLAGSVLRL